jgi:para-nitrobenzyl esterase
MITALQWTQAHIARFGGDPSLVTIAGESAGAEAVCYLLVSPVAHGLFKRAVIESGPCLTGTHGWGPHSAYANPQDDDAPQGYLAVSAKLAQKITGKSDPTLDDLRAVKQPRAFINSTTIRDSIDGYVIPANPIGYFQSGRLNAMEVLLGGNSFDGLDTYYIKYMQNPVTHLVPELLYEGHMRTTWGNDAAEVQRLYPLSRFDGNTNAASVMPNGDAAVVCPTLEMARLMTQAGGKAYSSHFQYGPVCGDVAGRMKTGPNWASHASELAWVWGYEPACYRNASEIALTTTMQNFWGSFTR